VRKTARRLGLHSEASYRFERGVDPDGQGRALDRAAHLLAELAGGAPAPGIVEAVGEPSPRMAEILLAPERVNRLLGTGLAPREIASLLARVEVACEDVAGELRCRPPRYRADLAIPADLIEEVARLYGYDAIQSTLPAAIPGGISIPPRRATLDAARTSLVSSGLTELMTFVCVDPGELDALRLPADDPRRRCVRVENPVHASQSTLRSQLVGSLLRCARNNLSRQQEGLRMFELSRVFLARGEGELPAEPLQAACLLTAPVGSLWQPTPPPVFFQAKGIAERLLADLGVEAAFQAGDAEPFLHPGASGAFLSGTARVAAVGELHPACAAAFEIDAQAAVLVLDVDALDGRRSPPPRYREVSRHPHVVRDLAVLLGRDVPAGQVIEAIRKRAGDALVSVTVFDRYEGKGIPEGRVSLAFRLVFQRVDRTLTEPEVTRATERVVALLAQDFGGELR
jgi:phenylalanyl-tRNA synthetase beta chain